MMPTEERNTRAPDKALWSDPTVRVFLGVFTLGALFVFWHELEPSLTFRPADAVVVGSDVARVKLMMRYSTQTFYQPEIFYRYEVAGVPYMGRKYRRTDLMDFLWDAQRRASAFVAGSKLQAWYDPRRPDEAVLSREPNGGLLLSTCMFLLIIWFGAHRKIQRPARAPAMSAPIN